MNTIKLPCPRCSGDGCDTHGDRHARTNMDVCRECGGEGTVPAETGEGQAASAAPETGRPFGEAAQVAPPWGGGGGW